MQIAILDQLVELRERSAVAPIRACWPAPEMNPDVKQRAEWASRNCNENARSSWPGSDAGRVCAGPSMSRSTRSIHRSFPGAKSLEIDNVNGTIEVMGSSGSEIEADIEKTLRADDQERADAAKREVKLDISQTPATTPSSMWTGRSAAIAKTARFAPGTTTANGAGAVIGWIMCSMSRCRLERSCFCPRSITATSGCRAHSGFRFRKRQWRHRSA